MSMTGFGRAQADLKTAQVICEIRCVNHRGLDVKFRLPRSLFAHEGDFLREVSKSFSRGRIDVVIELVEEHGGNRRLSWDAEMAKDLVGQVARFQEQKPEIKGELTISDLFLVRELFSTLESPAPTKDLHVAAHKVLKEAISDALQARAHEGRHLRAIIEASLKISERLVVEISKKLASSAHKHVKQLRKRVAELLTNAELDEARMAQEIAYVAERSDVAEEISRLGAHIHHFQELCGRGGASGRKLDFLCQEMLREANTASSKITDVATTYLVVDLKSEIERIREQVQNIE
jgi:uncharacterized protein (TIGR00255 family)